MNISRRAGARFTGWAVSIVRRGRHYGKLFSDSRNGGRWSALAAALAYRNRLLRVLPPLVKMPRKLVTSRTGVIGVQYRPAVRKSNGRWQGATYVATWSELSGVRRSRGFSVARFGRAQAKTLAVAARQRAIRDLLAQRRRQTAQMIGRSPNGA